MAAVARAALSAWHKLPCPAAPSCAYSSSAHSPFSHIASTSRSTLDDPLPAWDDLLPASRAPTKQTAKQKRAAKRVEQPKEHEGRAVKREVKRVLSPLPQSEPPKRPQRPLTPYEQRRPPSPRTQISPYLPLHTRERSFLLSGLRQALYSRSSSLAGRGGRRTAARGRAQAWDPNQAWVALARVLKYPEEVPQLPYSFFPSSTRAPEMPAGYDEPDPSAEPDSTGRTPIPLSIPELQRAFTVFATARPRTRNSLNRLLVVAELLARKKGAALSSPLDDDRGADGEEAAVQKLRGGGAGLGAKQWSQLMLFAGRGLRSTTQSDVQGALGLFSQYLQQHESQQRRRGRRARGRPDVLWAEAASNEKQRKLFNTLLHLARRARMWELFEQIRGRMRDTGIEPDAATRVEEMMKEEASGASVETLWRVFQEGLEEERSEDGRPARAMWSAFVWVLGKRGLLEDAMRVYQAMRAGKEVPLASLQPAMDDALSSSTATSVVRPPPPGDRIFTSLIQACAYQGDLPSALRIVRDVAASRSSPSAPATPLSIRHFLPLFRAFAVFGASPSPSGIGINRTLLSGRGISAHAASRSTSPLAVLSSGSSPSLPSRTTSDENPFTLSALYSLFESYLALPPPSPSSLPSLPFSGARTAPSAKDVYWILFAFDKLSGGESDAVLEVWDLLEARFGGSGADGWRGWWQDKRLKRLVLMHRNRVEQLRQRWEELQ
ncbi:hypothetical protein JCM10213v2_004331 [Rhodosporidiobolus nylandii]